MPATHSCPSLRRGMTRVGDPSYNDARAARIKQSKALLSNWENDMFSCRNFRAPEIPEQFETQPRWITASIRVNSRPFAV